MDNNKKNKENGLTEIDIGSLLQGKSKDPTLYDGFHDDIKNTERSLENELQSLYDDIMSSGPATIVPKPISVIASEKDEEETAEMPAPKKETADKSSWEFDFDSLETSGENEDKKYSNDISSFTSSTDNSKDDIFSLINSIKTDSEKEKGFDDILSEIKSNPDINSVDNSNEIFFSNSFPVNPKPEAAPAREAFRVDIPEQEEIFEVEDIFSESTPKKPANAPSRVPDVPVNPNGKSGNTQKGKNSQNGKKSKNSSAGEAVRKVVLVLSIIVIIISSGVLVNTYLVQPYLFKKNSQEIVEEFDVTNNEVVTESVSSGDTKYPAGMLAKYKQLYDINNEIAGWISIPKLEINLPIAKGSDNSYYLHRNIYKKYVDYGVPYFDYRMSNLKSLHRNNVVYGHNMRHDDLIFGMLENYRDIKYYKANPVIECNTIYGDHTWFICAVFITNSKSAQDNGYVFPYNFIDVDDTKFASYLEEIKKRSFYDTGVDVAVTDKLLTLSTCCYDFTDARLVVVAREKRAGESSNVDVSRAAVNPNPKYPQAWYDANDKTNPYVNDTRW